MERRRVFGHQGRVSRHGAAGRRVLAACALAALLAGCSAEKRHIGASPPGSAPTGTNDNRQMLYQTNLFEQAEGGRLFRWAGCDGCHTEAATGGANLSDGRWAHGGSVAQIYKTIERGAPGMPAYGTRLTPQELWQLSGYLKTLPKTKPNMRRRNSAAQQGEPSGSTWQGALR
jgi:cytochrome c oxidase cbb3-type subunit 3